MTIPCRLKKPAGDFFCATCIMNCAACEWNHTACVMNRATCVMNRAAYILILATEAFIGQIEATRSHFFIKKLAKIAPNVVNLPRNRP